MEPHAPSRRRRRNLVFDAARSPSVSLLRGMEKSIHPDQHFVQTVAAPRTQKPLPDTPRSAIVNTTTAPGLNTTKPTPTTGPLASLGRYATGWYDGSEMTQVSLNTPRHYHHQQSAMLSTSSPNLSLNSSQRQLFQPQLQFLEPRVYSPRLPVPSPSITPRLRRRSNGHQRLGHLATQFIRPVSRNDELWLTLPPSPPASAPLPSLAPRLMSPRSTEPLASPSQFASPSRARSTSPGAQQLTGRPDVSHQREASIEKALENLGVNRDGKTEQNRGRKITRHHIGPRSTDYGHFTPGSKLGVRNPIIKHECHPDEANWEEYTGDVDNDGEYILSPDYHTSLVEQYRALAAPVVGQWEDSTDEEEAVHSFRFVPKPLFWKIKTRDELIDAQRYDIITPSKTMGAVRSEQQSPYSGAPLRMMLPSQFKRRRGSGGHTSLAKPTKSESLPLRKRKQRAAPSKRTSAHIPKHVMTKRIGSTQRKRTPFNEPPLSLHLPQSIAAGAMAAAKRGPTDVERFAVAPHQYDTIRNASSNSPSTPQVNIKSIGLIEHGPSSPSASHVKSTSTGSTYSAKTDWSDVYNQSFILDGQYPQALEAESTMTAHQEHEADQDSPITPPLAPIRTETAGYATGLKNALKRISPVKLPLNNNDYNSTAPFCAPKELTVFASHPLLRRLLRRLVHPQVRHGHQSQQLQFAPVH